MAQVLVSAGVIEYIELSGVRSSSVRFVVKCSLGFWLARAMTYDLLMLTLSQSGLLLTESQRVV